MAKLKVPKKVTVAWLRRHSACEKQVDLFQRVFPNGMEPTIENLRLASKRRLRVSWFFQLIGMEHDVFCSCRGTGGSVRRGLNEYAKAVTS